MSGCPATLRYLDTGLLTVDGKVVKTLLFEIYHLLTWYDLSEANVNKNRCIDKINILALTLNIINFRFLTTSLEILKNG